MGSGCLGLPSTGRRELKQQGLPTQGEKTGEKGRIAQSPGARDESQLREGSRGHRTCNTRPGVPPRPCGWRSTAGRRGVPWQPRPRPPPGPWPCSHPLPAPGAPRALPCHSNTVSAGRDRPDTAPESGETPATNGPGRDGDTAGTRHGQGPAAEGGTARPGLGAAPEGAPAPPRPSPVGTCPRHRPALAPARPEPYSLLILIPVPSLSRTYPSPVPSRTCPSRYPGPHPAPVPCPVSIPSRYPYPCPVPVPFPTCCRGRAPTPSAQAPPARGTMGAPLRRGVMTSPSPTPGGPCCQATA